MAMICTSSVLAAGCGGGESASVSAPAASTPAQSAKPAAKGDVQVSMKDYKFIPAEVKVKTGQTIVWTNEDAGTQHDAVAREGDGPKSKLFNGGESYTWTAGKPGTIPYVCTIHPGMEGTITVR